MYDVEKDPLEMNNLADNPEFASAKLMLREKLDTWMQRCGDEGQAMELNAMNHQERGEEKATKKARPGKKKKRQD